MKEAEEKSGHIAIAIAVVFNGELQQLAVAQSHAALSTLQSPTSDLHEAMDSLYIAIFTRGLSEEFVEVERMESWVYSSCSRFRKPK